MTLLALVLSLLASPDDVARLRASAPTYLTLESAREHLGAARAAALVYAIDATLLLSIAHHESRYQHDEVTAERGGRVSCGVMTPEPVARCGASTMLEGYLAGAEHLRRWLDACRGRRRCALTGYAGGWYLIRYCTARRHRSCDTWRVFERRALWLGQGLDQRKTS